MHVCAETGADGVGMTDRFKDLVEYSAAFRGGQIVRRRFDAFSTIVANLVIRSGIIREHGKDPFRVGIVG